MGFDYRKDYGARMARKEEKESSLLCFLLTEGFVSAENVCDLFGVKALPPVYRFLCRLEKQG